jgi:hypothetical protein
VLYPFEKQILKIHHPEHRCIRTYSLQDKDFGCVVGRRRITIQPSPSGLAKIFILKPISNSKLQITNNKQITMTKIQNDKPVWVIGY